MTTLWSLGVNKVRGDVQVNTAITQPSKEREVWEAQEWAGHGRLNLIDPCADLRRRPSVRVLTADAPPRPRGRPRASHGFLLETIGGSSCSSHVSSCTFFTFLLDLARPGHCHLKKNNNKSGIWNKKEITAFLSLTHFLWCFPGLIETRQAVWQRKPDSPCSRAEFNVENGVFVQRSEKEVKEWGLPLPRPKSEEEGQEETLWVRRVIRGSGTRRWDIFFVVFSPVLLLGFARTTKALRSDCLTGGREISVFNNHLAPPWSWIRIANYCNDKTLSESAPRNSGGE